MLNVNEGFARFLETAPIWTIGLMVLCAMTVAAVIGRVMGHRASKGDEKDDAGPEAYIVSGVLGLLALLVGFTFSLPVDRYDTRRGLVLEEANAIGTAYLRAQLLDAPHRARVSAILMSYTDNRVVLAQAARGEGQALVRENDRLIADLWAEVVAVAPQIRTAELAGPFIESVNAVIDLDTARKVARDAHVPPSVFLLLFVYQIASAGVLGYVLTGRRSIVLTAMLFCLFTFALLLIIDIDRPTGGGVTESQRAMIMLRETLASQPPSSFDRSAP